MWWVIFGAYVFLSFILLAKEDMASIEDWINGWKTIPSLPIISKITTSFKLLIVSWIFAFQFYFEALPVILSTLLCIKLEEKGIIEDKE